MARLRLFEQSAAEQAGQADKASSEQTQSAWFRNSVDCHVATSEIQRARFAGDAGPLRRIPTEKDNARRCGFSCDGQCTGCERVKTYGSPKHGS